MSSASEPPESPTEPMAGAQLHGRLVWGMAMLFVIIMATVTLAIISAGEGTGGAPLLLRLLLIAVVIPAATPRANQGISGRASVQESFPRRHQNTTSSAAGRTAVTVFASNPRTKNTHDAA